MYTIQHCICAGPWPVRWQPSVCVSNQRTGACGKEFRSLFDSVLPRNVIQNHAENDIAVNQKSKHLKQNSESKVIRNVDFIEKSISQSKAKNQNRSRRGLERRSVLYSLLPVHMYTPGNRDSENINPKTKNWNDFAGPSNFKTWCLRWWRLVLGN